MDHCDAAVDVGVVNFWHALLVGARHQVLLYRPDVSEVLDVAIVCVAMIVAVMSLHGRLGMVTGSLKPLNAFAIGPKTSLKNMC